MEAILDWGINVVLWFQQFSPTLDLPFKVFTFTGEEEFFLILLPLIYWCLDRRVGARLMIFFLFSTYVNAVAKVLANQPRPWDYDPRVKKLIEATGAGGLPSGHTQATTLIWGYLASQFRRTWLWVVAGLLLVFVPLSRIYLGAHFPTDLLGGFLLGAILLLLYLWLEPGAEERLKERGLAWQLGLALVIPALLLVLFWEKDGITPAATLMGMGAGLALERRWVGFESGGVWWKQVLRFLLGVAVLFGLWSGLSAAFSGLEPELFFRFVRYGLVGLWAGLGAPWVFVKVRLAETGRAT